MPYEWLEHTSDVKVLVHATTLESLFSDGLKAMTDFLNPEMATPTEAVLRTIILDAPDVTSLFIDFLSTALLETYIQKAAFQEVTFQKLTETEVHATLSGFRFEGLREDIKAVTYHEADVHKNEVGEWETLVVFDI